MESSKHLKLLSLCCAFSTCVAKVYVHFLSKVDCNTCFSILFREAFVKIAFAMINSLIFLNIYISTLFVSPFGMVYSSQ